MSDSLISGIALLIALIIYLVSVFRKSFLS